MGQYLFIILPILVLIYSPRDYPLKIGPFEQDFVGDDKILCDRVYAEEESTCQNLVAPNPYQSSQKRAVHSGKDAGRDG